MVSVLGVLTGAEFNGTLDCAGACDGTAEMGLSIMMRMANGLGSGDPFDFVMD